MQITKRKKVSFSLFILWAVSWLVIVVGFNFFSDKLLNYVPHSTIYFDNNQAELKKLNIEPAKKPKYVVQIGIDGLATYAFGNGFTPNLDYLMHHGAYTLTNAHNVLPTSSAANWASVMYGTDPVKHGIVDQDLWNVHHTTTTQVNEGQVNVFEQIYNILSQTLPTYATSWFGMSSESSMFYNWGALHGKTIREILTDTKSTFFTTKNDAETFQTSQQILAQKPLFSFFYFVDPDIAGHSREWNSEEYNKSIGQSDKYVGGIIQNLKNQGMLDDTVIIINSDHGGVSQYHGHSSLAERKIPVIFYGKSLPVHGLIPDKITIYDLPVTVSWLLNALPLAAIWDGQPILTPFFNMYNMYDRSEKL